MRFADRLATSSVILAEGAITERLRRRADVQLHPTLFNTPLVCDHKGRTQLTEIYGQYREVAREHGHPILLCAPTWRVNQERIIAAGMSRSLNREAVNFMTSLAESLADDCSPVHVAGLVGPRHDCYRPDEALEREEALQFHRWQVNELAEAGVEVALGQTFPAVSEALGLALACREESLPCILSFVIDRQGVILDGTPLIQAVQAIDIATDSSFPLGYMVNCVHPSFLLENSLPPELFRRLVGIQANASSLDHTELDGAEELQQDDREQWGEQMVQLNHQFGVRILGGCCGTDDSYLRYVAARVIQEHPSHP